MFLKKFLSNALHNFLGYKQIKKLKKKEFKEFGRKSSIHKPYLQLSGLKNVVIGENTTILENARIAVYGDFENSSIIIGNRCYIGYGFTVLSKASNRIRIGNDVLIASNVCITNENHGIDPENEVPYMNQEITGKDISIGTGTWIGQNVCILPGVSIGKKSIIGAGSVVTKSVPDYSIAVGNPARVIKTYNFNDHCWERILNEKE